MNDLISKCALLNIVEPRLDYLRDKNGPYDHYTDGYEECYDRIDEAPTVDAVEVVRCGKCVNFRRHTKINTEFGACSIGNVTKHESGYCDSGERS